MEIEMDVKCGRPLAFFEWIMADPEGRGEVDPLYDAMVTALEDGTWAENDVPSIVASLRRGGLDRRHKRTWRALVPALDAWLIHRHHQGYPVEHIVEFLNDHDGECLADVE